jgi:DNA helicase II / ATP-dependent DNA helicase PcrA
MDKDQYNAEARRLKDVLALLLRKLHDMEEMMENEASRIEQISSSAWDDSPHMILSMDDIIELSQASQQLDNAGNLLALNRHQYVSLKAMQSAPYFGRIDVLLPGEPRPLRVYIGRQALMDDSYALQVYDWRAPICSIFYDHTIGDCSYQSPQGEVLAHLSLKRQFQISDGILEYYVDTDLKIDDTILLETLSRQSSAQLKVIINSIQKAQNQAIRHGTTRNLLVSGPAGCGKTSVGMHRLAYLLYHDRNLSSSKIIIFAHNQFFNNYIEGIIPELGEEAVRHSSFYHLCQALLPADYQIYTYYEQAEAIMAHTSTPREKLVAIKYSQQFADFITEKIASIRFQFADISLSGEIILRAGEIENRWLTESRSYSMKDKKDRLLQYIASVLDDYLSRKDNLFFDRITEGPDISKGLFIREFRQLELQKVSALFPSDPVGLYLDLLRMYAEDLGLASDLWQTTFDHVQRHELYFEDAVLLLYIKGCLGDLPVENKSFHILIDEAQDCCQLQHRVFQQLYPSSRFTLLADASQAIIPALNCHTDDLLSLYQADHVYLEKSYRSTRQINELAQEILGKKYEVFSRNGDAPKLVLSHNIPETLVELVGQYRQTNRSVCILTRTIRESRNLYSQIAGKLDIALISSIDDSSDLPVTVMSVVLAKGLEFDCVIIPQLAPDASPIEKNELGYTMVTRALHQLCFVFDAKSALPVPDGLSRLAK